MAVVTFYKLAEKYRAAADVLVALIVVSGTLGLFLFDISAPRGEVDGIGYAALVAMCVRFGERSIIACAVLTTILTLVASQLLPDSGISVEGMWANRGFAVLAIWIVAIILVRRLALEAYIAKREKGLEENQATLGLIVREALMAEKPQEERIRFLVEQAAETLGADFCAILRRFETGGPIRAMNVWDRRERRHFTLPSVPVNTSPGFREAMHQDQVVYADDILTSERHVANRDFLIKMGVRASLSADTTRDFSLGGVWFAFREPHHWINPEFAFARALANLVSLSFIFDRNRQTMAALDRVNEGIFLEDELGELRYTNQAAKELSGGDGALGIPPAGNSLVSESDRQEVSRQGRDLEIQRVRLPDGGILTRVNDMTGRNAELLERRKLEARLQRSAKMEAIGQLAGGVAHDFNNILGAIQGFAGFLDQDLPEKSAQRGFATRILSACERGKELVEQILAFARVRGVERGVADLGVLVRRNRDYLAGLLPAQIALRVELEDIALPIFGSPVQVGQLISNLFINARDSFSASGGVITIAARLSRPDELERLRRGVEERNERSWGHVWPDCSYGLLQVRDEGEGIAPTILDKIFEPFFTTKGRLHGTGLGLAVVHGVVESMGGICHVRSVLGEGTAFSIHFPLVAETSETAAATLAAEPADLRGRERVLVVDDETDIADMLSIGLERLGYEVVSANDPLEALAAFQEDPHAFDIVITDQVMLGLRGLELIRRLKQMRPDLKTILCTGYSDGATEETALEAGADKFFQKPVDSRRVAASIRHLMERGA